MIAGGGAYNIIVVVEVGRGFSGPDGRVDVRITRLVKVGPGPDVDSFSPFGGSKVEEPFAFDEPSDECWPLKWSPESPFAPELDPEAVTVVWDTTV